MVLVLVSDVGFNGVQVSRAYRECAVSPLPAEFWSDDILLVDPMGRFSFQESDEVVDALIAQEGKRGMNVVDLQIETANEDSFA